MYSEGLFDSPGILGTCGGCGPSDVIPITDRASAIREARRQLSCIGWPNACAKTDDEVVVKVRSESTLFTCSTTNCNQVRFALFGQGAFPACDSPKCSTVPTKYSCSNGQCVADANGPYANLAACQAACSPGGGGNTGIIIGIAAVALLAVGAIALTPQKKIIVAMV